MIELRRVQADAVVPLSEIIAANGRLPSGWVSNTEAVGVECDLDLVKQLAQKAANFLPPEQMDPWLAPRLHAALRVPRRIATDEGMWAWLAFNCQPFVEARFRKGKERVHPWRFRGAWSRNAFDLGCRSRERQLFDATRRPPLSPTLSPEYREEGAENSKSVARRRWPLRRCRRGTGTRVVEPRQRPRSPGRRPIPPESKAPTECRSGVTRRCRPVTRFLVGAGRASRPRRDDSLTGRLRIGMRTPQPRPISRAQRARIRTE